MSNYFVSTDKKLLNPALIHAFLTETYWAKGIPFENILKRIDNALCFGLYDSDKNQIGFARVITDSESFAYLADVFVLETHQGKGLSRVLMDYIMSYPDIKDLRRFMLGTRDAHFLYEKYGFNVVTYPQIWMEKVNLDVSKILIE